MTKFAHFDTKRPDGVYVQFEKIIEHDDTIVDPRTQDEGISRKRLKAWRNDEWHYTGIMARAHVNIIRNGTGTVYCLESAGVWGVESDAGSYGDTLFAEQCEELKSDIAFLAATPVTYQEAT